MKVTLLILSLFAIVSLVSCNNDCPKGRYYFEQDFVIELELLDKATGVNLLEIGSNYHRDSVKVYHEDGELVFPGPVPLSGHITFQPYQTNNRTEIPLDSSVSEHYFIHLIKDGLDIDTLQLDYYAYLDTDCNRKRFSYLKLYYNGMLRREKESSWQNYLYITYSK